MNRTSVNFWVDFFLFFAMIGLVITGLIILFTLPLGTDRTMLLWVMSRHDFGVVHSWFAAAAVLLTVVHLALHWEWVCCFVGSSCADQVPCRSSRILWGVSFAVVMALLIGGGLWWASDKVEPVSGEERGYGNPSADRPSFEPSLGRGRGGEPRGEAGRRRSGESRP